RADEAEGRGRHSHGDGGNEGNNSTERGKCGPAALGWQEAAEGGCPTFPIARFHLVADPAPSAQNLSIFNPASTSCSRSFRRWKSRCATRSSALRAGPRTAF